MDLSPTEDQRLIAESAEAFLGQACPITAVRRQAEHGDAFDATLWQGIAELGWCGLRLPEAVGGLGLGWVEQVLLHEQLGRHLACVPFLESVALSTSVLQTCPAQPAIEVLWPALARDALRLACALPSDRVLAVPGSAAARGPAVVATADAADASCRQSRPAPGASLRSTPAGFVLDGCWPRVGAAAQADRLLLPAHDGAGVLHWLLVDGAASGLMRTSLPGVDGTRPCAEVAASAVFVDRAHALASGALAHAVLARARCLAAIALAGEQIGCAQAAFDRTLAYVLQRHQFEQPIARFQAIKHRLAGLLVQLETARSAVYGAACLADTSPDDATLLLYAAQAREAATETALACTREAIQLHGGAGFTWEFDLHLFLRRAQVDSQLLGAPAWWCEQVAAQLLDAELAA